MEVFLFQESHQETAAAVIACFHPSCVSSVGFSCCFVLFSSLLVMPPLDSYNIVNSGLILQISFTELKIQSQIPFLSGLEQFDIWRY